ncbi:DUF3159 domain-containing protein [Patulibacter sp. NPDC049589]|uniref:DUF3159 domain-containing protein n=1 Tax=Patulibacter sp. NPDC049589 TaxID=3154731 RepID=UPI0034460BCE
MSATPSDPTPAASDAGPDPAAASVDPAGGPGVTDGAPGAPADPTPASEGARPLTGPASARAAVEPPSLLDAVGGPLGIAESSVPAALFVAVYTIFGHDATIAAIVAVVVGAALTIARLTKGQTLQFALSGLFGIALAGFIVAKTGNASDFFLPGILLNVAYATAYFVSIVVRWPIMGLLIGSLTGEPTAWRKDPLLARTYTRVTWIWVGLFALRLVVQLPLYLADSVTVLGVAKVAMGIPLFALGIWLTYLVVQRATAGAPAATPPAAAA